MLPSYVLFISSARFVGGWGLTPLWCLSTPKFVLTPRKIVKISQKYIADPLWFSHKWSTVYIRVLYRSLISSTSGQKPTSQPKMWQGSWTWCLLQFSNFSLVFFLFVFLLYYVRVLFKIPAIFCNVCNMKSWKNQNHRGGPVFDAAAV